MLVCWRVLVSVDSVAVGPELLWPQGKCLPVEQPVKPIDDQTEAWKLWPSRKSDAFHTHQTYSDLWHWRNQCASSTPVTPGNPKTPKNPRHQTLTPPQQHTCIAGHLTPLPNPLITELLNPPSQASLHPCRRCEMLLDTRHSFLVLRTCAQALCLPALLVTLVSDPWALQSLAPACHRYEQTGGGTTGIL